MAVRVPRGGDHRRRAGPGHAEERVPRRRGPAGVHGHPHVAVGAVLEPDRHGQARGELAVHLALRGPRADRAPRHGVGDVLRRDRVQPLTAHREAEGDDVEQEPPGHPQAPVHVVGAVHAGVVDEPLPARHRARLLEVDAHDDQELIGQRLAQRGQLARVVQPGGRIVHRAGTGDHEEAVVLAVQHRAHLSPGPFDHVRLGGPERQFIQQRRGREQRLVAQDPGIAGVRHDALLPRAGCPHLPFCRTAVHDQGPERAGRQRLASAVRRGRFKFAATKTIPGRARPVPRDGRPVRERTRRAAGSRRLSPAPGR